MYHYRLYTFYIPETGGTCVSGMAQFFLYYVKMPQITDTDAVVIAADDLLQALERTSNSKITYSYQINTTKHLNKLLIFLIKLLKNNQ